MTIAWGKGLSQTACSGGQDTQEVPTPNGGSLPKVFNSQTENIETFYLKPWQEQKCTLLPLQFMTISEILVSKMIQENKYKLFGLEG